MAWERRRDRKYLYRSVKVGGRVEKRYYGRGLEARMVEAMQALARAEAAARRTQTQIIDEACALTERLFAANM